jgi:hypothetical protein
MKKSQFTPEQTAGISKELDRGQNSRSRSVPEIDRQRFVGK